MSVAYQCAVYMANVGARLACCVNTHTSTHSYLLLDKHRLQFFVSQFNSLRHALEEPRHVLRVHISKAGGFSIGQVHCCCYQHGGRCTCECVVSV
jgi:hypothetical protein